MKDRIKLMLKNSIVMIANENKNILVDQKEEFCLCLKIYFLGNV